MKERIQEKAKDLFMRYGFKSVTMDEIASQMGVSKKTIYHYFVDKDALVESVMLSEMEQMQAVGINQSKGAVDAIDEILKDMDMMEMVMKTMNPQIIFDLEKFYPATYSKFKNHKNSFMLDLIRHNLKRGIEEGLYRPEIDIDIIAKFRLESAFIALNQEIYPYGKYSLMKVASEIYFTYLHGIVTVKGKSLIEKYIQQREKNKSITV